MTLGSTTTFTAYIQLVQHLAGNLDVGSIVQEAFGVVIHTGLGGTQILFTGGLTIGGVNVYHFLGVQTDVAVIDSGSITNQTELSKHQTVIYFYYYDNGKKKIQTQNLGDG